MFLAAIAALGTSARASFAPGTIIALRVGDGSGTVPFDSSYLAQPIFLDVFNIAGAAHVGTYSVASSGSFSTVLTSRSDDHDGHLNLSPDGQFITFGGYRSTPGSAYPVTQTAAVTPRVIGVVDSSFNINTTTALNSAYNGVTLTAVATDTGSRFWTGGGNETTGSGGLRFVSGVGTSSSTNISQHPTGSTADSMRNVRMFGENVYVNTASQGSYTNRGSYRMTINGQLPLPSNGTVSIANPVIVNHEGSLNDDAGNPDPDGKGKLHPKSDAVYLDYNNDGTYDTAYSTGGKEELEKWELNLDSSSPTFNKWLRTDAIYLQSGEEINALGAYVTGTTLNVFASTDGGIYSLADLGGTGSISSPTISAPDIENKRYLQGPYAVAALANTQFRGLVVVVPEPATIALLGATGLLLSRRRKAAR